MDMATGKIHEIASAKALTRPPGSTVVFDKGFNDYGWYPSLSDQKTTFITRLKHNAVVKIMASAMGILRSKLSLAA